MSEPNSRTEFVCRGNERENDVNNVGFQNKNGALECFREYNLC